MFLLWIHTSTRFFFKFYQFISYAKHIFCLFWLLIRTYISAAMSRIMVFKDSRHKIHFYYNLFIIYLLISGRETRYYTDLTYIWKIVFVTWQFSDHRNIDVSTYFIYFVFKTKPKNLYKCTHVKYYVIAHNSRGERLIKV